MVCFKVSGKGTDRGESNWYVQSKNAIVSELQRIGKQQGNKIEFKTSMKKKVSHQSTPVHTDIRQFLQSVSGSKTPTTPMRPYTTDRSVTPPRSPDIRQYGTSCRRLNFEDKGTKSPVLERVYPEFLNIMN
jgi:hypothetical protein